MHELPELYLYRAMLAERYAGARITAWNFHDKLVDGDGMEEVIGSTVWYVERRANHLVFHLDIGKRLVLYMSNKSYLFSGAPDDHGCQNAMLTIGFGDDRTLAIYGLNKGDVQLLSVKAVEEQLRGYGLDPLDKGFNGDMLRKRLSKKRSSMKAALMDQKTIAGIGAVYSDEIMFAAGIRPDMRANSLSAELWERLYRAIVSVLQEAISHGGITKQPMHDQDSLSGGYAERLQVYGREGEACKRCGGTVSKVLASGRKAYACLSCQLEQ
ncbi:endonuclease VIII [Paenibacillus sp. J5C_2022]|uniref:Fpg/Nei family DNA glycosylase n=1 Tax=Paenibacillus sp. J5C2022 TaxID=2977129 RepID=UPI0021CEDB70|nr:DNA-formamidopyrimidine glycosylase family protein [Paenibacillus sp. J5C2022]MCU6708193.1 endonuclease VIII [Paenibacillus sp. J5C2022]